MAIKKVTLHGNIADRNDGEVSAFLQNILESSTEYSTIGKDLEGMILIWNEGAKRLYGYEPHEVVGKANSSILLTSDDVRAGRPREILNVAPRVGKSEGTIGRLRKTEHASLPELSLRRASKGKAYES